jgi:ubiquinone/menaquinone biosynthesis C-methylase UbiE
LPTVADSIAPEYFRRLHHGAIERPEEVRGLLERVQAAGTLLDNGFDGSSNPRTARIKWVRDASVGLAARHIRPDRQPQICLSFELDGSRYFFAAPALQGDGRIGLVEIALPRAIYKTERRDLPRDSRIAVGRAPQQVELSSQRGWRRIALVTDSSPGGLGVRLDAATGEVPAYLRVRFLSGDRAGEDAYASVCHSSPASDGSRGAQLGLSVTSVPPGPMIPVERRERVLDETKVGHLSRQAALVAAGLRAVPHRLAQRLGINRRDATPIHVVEYPNDRGEPIRGIVNNIGDGPGGLAVVIPPAWGRTKETLLPLALTLVRTFAEAGQPITVLRFDGSHRRGESYVDPRFRNPGDEYLGFRFSQAVSDIHSTLEFLATDEHFRPSNVVLVTVSIASVDGRRAIATDPTSLVSGWVALVGIGDLQSCLRTASGGVDYGYGLPRGVRFGRQELTGMVVDVDKAGPDAIGHNLFYFEDARRDMATIKVPITWIHGRHDGWVDLDRIRRLMSSGDTRNRRLLEVRTGHQLRTSREALEVFQLVSEEVARIGLGRRLEPMPPRLDELERRRLAERARRPPAPVDLRQFWRNYLVGRDGSVGIELMTATNAYYDLMSKQVAALALAADDRVLDLGSGAGDFAVFLAGEPNAPGVWVTEVDYVREALRRGRQRLARISPNGNGAVRHLTADLDLGRDRSVPLAAESFDAVLASFLISYLREPHALLLEAHRLLRPGGRLVLSSLRRDADSSCLYADGRAELHPQRMKELFAEVPESEFEELQRKFINDNAKIFNFEDDGYFRFWDADELSTLVQKAGFALEGTQTAFGNPPQAVIVTARRS